MSACCKPRFESRARRARSWCWGSSRAGPRPATAISNFRRASSPAGSESLPVKRFREKPDAATAARFLKAGNFYWNAGMFFWKTSVLLDALRQHLPKTASLLGQSAAVRPAQICQEPRRGVSEDARTSRSTTRCWNAPPTSSGLPAGDIGWNDVGSWNAVYELHARDRAGNALRTHTMIENSTGNYVDAEKKLVALLGVKDLIVVDTPDALLIADRSRAQQVGELVKLLEAAGHHHLL